MKRSKKKKLLLRALKFKKWGFDDSAKRLLDRLAEEVND